jgi:hypothetical protein
MLCSLCGRKLWSDKDGVLEARVVKVQVFDVVIGTEGRPVLRPGPMTDGSTEKYTCLVCPAFYGMPLEFIGEGSTFDG